MKHGKSNADRRNSPAEDRKLAGYKDKDPMKDKVRDTIAALSTTEGSTRRDKLPKDKKPTRLEDMECVDDTNQGRKDSLEKRILTTSQIEKASESLRYSEPKKSTSEDSAIQEEME